jgi:hypothetical protein
VQLNDFPGYNDAAYSVLLRKLVAVAEMKRLEADRYNIYIEENVSLSWESSLAKRVTIQYQLKNGNLVVLDSLLGQIKLNGKNFWLPEPPTAENTIITAIAYDDNGQNSKQVHIVVADRPQAEILFLDARRLGRVSNEVEFEITWDVKWTKKLMISRDWDRPYEIPVTTKSIAIRVPSVHVPIDVTITLYAYSFGTKYPEPTKRDVHLYT